MYWAGATLCPALCWKTQQCTVGPWHDGGALLLTTPESVTPLGMCITTTHLPDKNRMFATHSLSYFHVFHIIKTGHDAQSSSFKLAMGYPEMGWSAEQLKLVDIISLTLGPWFWPTPISWFTCHIGGPSRQPQAATCHCSGVRSSLLWLLRLFVRLSLHIHMSSCINTRMLLNM